MNDNDDNMMEVVEDTKAATPEAGPTPRLMITKMELENFKSYAGVKEIGPFHKCFSSVVGPNGSGKSNVIDAMLFVFGKRAKKLRLNKVSELIHSSDAYKYKPLQYARVSVFFQEIIDTGDGDEDYEVVPDSQIIVSRTAKRDNSSSYKLNGKNCQFKEVANYLNSKGIDLDNNRFLILQGEVELISMMPPKGKTENDEGLLEYLEDIIGSNKFVEETNEAEAKVEALNELRQERLNRVKAVEKEKDSLEGAKLEAEAILKKEKEVRHKKNILYQLNAHGASRDFDKLEVKREEVDNLIQSGREKLNESTAKMSEIESTHAEKIQQYEELDKEVRRAKEEFTAFERNDIKMREEVKHAKEEKKKLDGKLKVECKKILASAKKIDSFEADIPELESRLEDLSKSKAEEEEKLEAMFDEVKGITEGLRVKLQEKTQELAPIQQERSLYQVAMDTATAEVDLLEGTTRRAKEQLESAEKEFASLDKNQSDKRSQLASCEDELAESNQRLADIKKEEIELGSKEKTLMKKYNEFMTRAEDAKLNTQSKTGRSKVCLAILKAVKDGPLKNAGVVGRMGDLCAINAKYDIAASTACGNLDHIVVRTTKGVQQCIEFLRKYKLGRANFISLEKMKKGAHDRAVDTPENAPRLFELITTKSPEITPALYLGVGNTLVAPDLEVATRWAYDYGKRWRVVTLDGKLVETSGAMSGGGSKVRRGGMKLKNSNQVTEGINNEAEDDSDDLDNIQTLLKEAEDELKECRDNRRKLIEETKNLQKLVKNLQIKIPKLSVEIEGYDTTRSELGKRLPDMRKATVMTESDQEKLLQLKEKVSKCKADMASCSMQASKLEGEVAKIQKKILDAGGEPLKRQKTVCEELDHELENANKNLNSSRVGLVSAQKALNKSNELKKALETDIQLNEDKIYELMLSLKKLEEDAAKVMEEYEHVKKLEKEQKKALELFNKEFESLKKNQSRIKGAEIELKAQKDDLEKQIKECTKRKQYWDDELQKLRAAEEQDGDFDMSDDEEDEEDGQEADKIGMEDIENVNQNNDSRKYSLPVLSNAALNQYDKDEVKNTIKMLEQERETLAKNANMGAIEEYRKKEADYISRVAELDEATNERNEARRKHEELRRLRLEKFMEGFGKITLKLKEMYQMITLGGDAELELVDSLDPFSEGIVFSVRPPKKSWKNISNLSGGEKTLSSLALVFALHHYKPTPLYVMDEIDAALDFKNVSIVANYIKERTKDAQFIIISLRNNMFELADRLVGIYKTNNCTKSVAINPRAFGKSVGLNSKVLNDRTNNNA